MMLTRENPFELLVDSHHGQYVPQVFAETVRRDLFGETISAENWSILESGPDHEHYWDAWDAVLCSAETADGISLCQDGDLWAVNWSLIGDPEEIDDLAEIAEDRISADPVLSSALSDLFANLRYGPSSGRWSQELLTATRDGIQAICDQIERNAPLYWRSDFGMCEERRIDLERMLIERSGGAIKALSAYW